MTPKIQVNNMSKAFGTKQVLKNVNLTIPKGESLVILGGSGTGKSVLIKSILSLLEMDEGEIILDGKKLNYNKSAARDKILSQSSYLFQGGALFDSLKIWENITFGIKQQRKLNRKEARDITIERLEEVGLGPEVVDLFPAELSGGMQKRVALARAVATRPEILFFDEPTTGLDPIMSDVINELILQSVKRLGATAITITHDLGSLYKIADKVCYLREGMIDWYGPLSSLSATDNQHLRKFIGNYPAIHNQAVS